jgi:hypothetical protein
MLVLVILDQIINRFRAIALEQHIQQKGQLLTLKSQLKKLTLSLTADLLKTALDALYTHHKYKTNQSRTTNLNILFLVA